MNRRMLIPLVAVALFGLMAAFATSALALPTYTTLCSGCHASNASITVHATPGTVSTASTQYTVAVSNPAGAAGWAVFAGATKVAGGAGTGGTVVLTNGVAYKIFGAGNDASTNQIQNSITVTPPVPDLTAPTTTSDAKATYVSSATIKLTAADNLGGSGVAHTYYILDGAARAEGTTVSTSTIGAHTLEFWSIDVAANAETPHKTASFAITAPVPDTTAPTTTSDAKPVYVGSAAIKLTAADDLGGSGVAHTYYILDGGIQAEGTTVGTSVVGTHTIEFWSQDASGNVEAPHNNAAFTVTVMTPPVVSTHKVTVRINLKHRNYKTMRATLVNKRTGAKFTAKVDRKGYIVFRNVATGSYKLNVTGKKFKFKTRTLNIGLRDVSARFK